MFGVVAWLENYAEAELKLAHANGRTWCGISFNVSDLASRSVAEAVYALVARKGQNGMVEDIISIEAELKRNSFRDGEVFQQRHIIVERMRTAKRIESSVADLAATGKSQRT